MSKETTARLRELVRENPSKFAAMTYSEIAREYGVGRHSIGAIFRENGIQSAGAANKPPSIREVDRLARETDEKITRGKLVRDEEYWDVIMRAKGMGVSLTGEYWERYRTILAWKIKHGERTRPPDWSKVFGFKTT